ncbi:hypothetical protein [Microvirga subterranea]|uniref:Uncharacterized protein n=1 Tax=Microvirga subterranea TaxID=186651 RepID=A0A370HJ15_9HYPH|nr:hypothetical protein [Microvirga subterranea]RDI58573.1 hypothetical protein DES45_10596 [Microvirga subterranea]
MADAFYREAAASRNVAYDTGPVAALPTSPRSSTHGLSALSDGPRVNGAPASDPRAILLAAAGHADMVSLGDLVGAIPDHPQPLAAVLALVDEGLLGMDLEAPFGPDLRLWRP